MLHPLFDIKALRAQIQLDTVVLTPNQRLARALRDAWGRDCLEQGQAAWRQPSILALESWIEESWQALLDHAWPPALQGGLVSSAQEQLLWQQILERDAESTNLETLTTGAAQGLAELARRGWQLKNQWQIQPEKLANSAHEGAQLLLRWGKTFEELMLSLKLITREKAIEHLIQGFLEHVLPQVERIVLVSFQSIDPLNRQLIEAAATQVSDYSTGALAKSKGAKDNGAKSSGTEDKGCQSPSTDLPGQLYAAVDTDSEIAAAANWALQLSRTDPGARIGVVIPELAKLRNKVERIFRDRFEPHWCLPQSHYQPPPFNISAGIALAETPLVSAALKLLALNRQQLPWEHYCQLLHTRYWGDWQNEMPVRSHAELLLRELGKLTPSSGDFRHCLRMAENALQKTSDDDRPSHRLQTLADKNRRLPSRVSCREWANRFQSQLYLLGWPGRHTLDSQEYQQQSHWLELLEVFSSLDQVSLALSLDEALHHLSRLAHNSVFQVETPDSQVLILGTLEAAGLQFSHLWISGMDNRQWPQPISPHPLLPIHLQRQLEMPRAAATKEVALSQEIFHLFCQSTHNLVCSYAVSDGDKPIQPARMVACLPAYEIPASTTKQHPWVTLLGASTDLETVDDHRGPALTEDQQRIRGGSRLLQEQAACPFNAFAIWRLGATPLPEPLLGLDGLTRGNLLHLALEIFWQQLPGQAALLALDKTQVLLRVETAIEAAAQQLQLQGVGVRLLALEKQRQCRLMLTWINDIESTRAPFSVTSSEAALSLELAGVNFSMRIDRIDKLDDGRHVLIDYKTGDAHLGNLTQERLREPQLPLYALASNLPLAAVIYAVISNKGKGVRVDGVGSLPDAFSGLPELTKKQLPKTWEDALKLWHNSLIKTVEEFKSGQAEVHYYHPALQSRFAHLEPLNRWPGQFEEKL